MAKCRVNVPGLLNSTWLGVTTPGAVVFKLTGAALEKKHTPRHGIKGHTQEEANHSSHKDKALSFIPSHLCEGLSAGGKGTKTGESLQQLGWRREEPQSA